jgi:hypothetical protein
MSIISFIADTGENPNFVAFMAHSGVAFFVMTLAHGSYTAAAICIGAALAKEYGFDLRYEKNPPQTVKDSTLDFAGYLTGIVLGLVMSATVHCNAT